MVLKCALCSDIDLEYRFKHMTSKKSVNYELEQLKHLDILVDRCLEEKIDVLIVAGNIFGSSKPKNNTIKRVVESLNKLIDEKITVFILPGPHDIPLYFSDDTPVHFILESINNVHILQHKDFASNIKKDIFKPVFKEKVKGIPIQIFTTTSPFKKPDELNFSLEIDEDYSNWFIISDLFSFKKDIDNHAANLIKKLKETKIDVLLLGGIVPDSLNMNGNGFQVIPCPQIHQNNIDHYEKESGLAIRSFDNGIFSEVEKLIKISNFNLKHEILNINTIALGEINKAAIDLIRKEHDQKYRLLKLTLLGKLSKDDYHEIKIYDLNNKGQLLNYYFELSDLIEFHEETVDISGLSLLNELEIFTENLISEKENDNDLSESEKAEEIVYLKEAIQTIKKDWNE
ncbi:MAG: metallophosphoesterase [Promethearchaeota archaeon]